MSLSGLYGDEATEAMQTELCILYDREASVEGTENTIRDLLCRCFNGFTGAPLTMHYFGVGLFCQAPLRPYQNMFGSRCFSVYNVS